MQNKGALKFLAIALAVACAYQLSFTFVTRHVENKAAQYAAGDAVKEQNYLDSIKSQTVYNLGFIKFNYKQCKEKEINLGLDLRGGMNVMLEISIEDVIRALSNDSKDPGFNQALVQAREEQKNSTKDYITLFAEAYEKISNGGRLSYIFNTPELREQITPNSTNAEVIKVLRSSASVLKIRDGSWWNCRASRSRNASANCCRGRPASNSGPLTKTRRSIRRWCRPMT